MTNDDIKTCDKCQHYTHDDGSLQGFENCGRCILMGDWNGGVWPWIAAPGGIMRVTLRACM